MLKKLGLPTLALMAVLGLAGAPGAQAGVHFGVRIGPAYPPPYVYSQPYYYGYSYPDYYVYPPDYGYSFGYWGGHRDRWYREHRGHEWREHARHDHGHDRGWHDRGRDHDHRR